MPTNVPVLSCQSWLSDHSIYFIITEGLTLSSQGALDLPNSTPFRTTGTPGFEAYSAGNWGTYVIPAVVEKAYASGQYTGSPVSQYDAGAGIPTQIAAGTPLAILCFVQAGGTPSPSDTMIGSVVVPCAASGGLSWPNSLTRTIPKGWGCLYNILLPIDHALI